MSTPKSPWAEPADRSIVAWGEPVATVHVRLDESEADNEHHEHWFDADAVHLGSDPLCWDALCDANGGWGDPYLLVPQPLHLADQPRPPRPVSEHEGYEWRAEPAHGWRSVEGKRCRFLVESKGCGQPSVAELERPRYSAGGSKTTWWAYCGMHLYRHWMEDGQVFSWTLRKVSDA